VHTRLRTCALACAVILIALTAFGCAVIGSPGGTPVSETPAASERPVQPPAWVLKTPQSAVRSYIDWVSYAYLIGESDVATLTMGSYEEVRVNSYIELNKEKSQRLRQKLVSISFGKQGVEGTLTVVPTKERWEYSYLSLDLKKSLSPTYTASYDATYSLAPKNGGWVVESVAAKELGEVK
jgi:hypothetical protein